MLIRHAEKPNDDSDTRGVTQKGARSHESLSVRGWQRAGALAALLAPSDGHFQDPSLAEPQFLYASKFLKSKGSKRAIQTITPLAHKLAIRINDDFHRSEYERMLEEVFLCKGVVLICWQREYLPEIAQHILSDSTIAPRDWPEDRFDMVWVFDLKRSSTKYGFKQIPQSLLMGDRATRIT
jgi:hypothetical protein